MQPQVVELPTRGRAAAAPPTHRPNHQQRPNKSTCSSDERVLLPKSFSDRQRTRFLDAPIKKPMASITESVTHRHTQERQSNIPWLAPFGVALVAALAVPILLPGAIVPAEQHVLVVLALFLFWPIHYLLAKRRSAAGTVAERPIALPVTLKALLLWLPINLLVAGMSLLAWSSAGYLLLGVALYSYCLRHPWLRHHPERLACLGGAWRGCSWPSPLLNGKAHSVSFTYRCMTGLVARS
ncbi:MAG: hypothetical protein R2867_17175 [Caldilineaceae bacterium]